MTFRELRTQFSYKVIKGNDRRYISSVTDDSRKTEPDGIFVCLSGPCEGGEDYAREAAGRGAACIVAGPELCGLLKKNWREPGPALIETEDVRAALADLAAAWNGRPAERLEIIGITGTKGKTTTAFMLRGILERSGRKTGLIGTNGVWTGREHRSLRNTTPGALLLQELLAEMVREGCTHVVMEVSSQALKQQRTAGIRFAWGIYTNLSPDHIGAGEHADFNEYKACKMKLFGQSRRALLNGDDRYADEMSQAFSGVPLVARTEPEKGHLCDYARRLQVFGRADYRASQIRLWREPGVFGVRFWITGRFGKMECRTPLPGRFSVQNALLAASCALECGVRPEDVQKALEDVRIKGRTEVVWQDETKTVLIDYAHNAVSLQSVLCTLRSYSPRRLVCLFGCGGDRDHERREQMGEVSARFADLSIITEDNSRTEDPKQIIGEILSGIHRGSGFYRVIPDRKDAIRYALTNAKRGDVILLAGKGHEDYQETGGIRRPFSEHALVKEICQEERRNT